MNTKKPRAKKIITRAQALRKMSAGADPNLFLKHANKHVVAKAQRLIARGSVQA
jgi:hypothetical protein